MCPGHMTACHATRSPHMTVKLITVDRRPDVTPRAFLVGTAKNEGPYILEWVAHHLEVGFTDIALYQNDSDDLTHEIMRTLAGLGVIQYFPNPPGAAGIRSRPMRGQQNCPNTRPPISRWRWIWTRCWW